MTAPIIPYQPSTYFYREYIRSLKTKADLREFALELAIEVERHKQFIRARGMVPPKWLVLQTERKAKKILAEVIQFSQSEAPARTQDSRSPKV